MTLIVQELKILVQILQIEILPAISCKFGLKFISIDRICEIAKHLCEELVDYRLEDNFVSNNLAAKKFNVKFVLISAVSGNFWLHVNHYSRHVCQEKYRLSDVRIWVHNFGFHLRLDHAVKNLSFTDITTIAIQTAHQEQSIYTNPYLILIKTIGNFFFSISNCIDLLQEDLRSCICNWYLS